MAYIVAAESTPEPVASATLTVPVPAGHQTNDLILMFIGQDGGGTNITTAASGWNLIGSQAAAQGQRAVVYWKLATSSSEPDVEWAGANDEWCVYAVVVRGVNTSNPINGSNRTDSANSTSNNLVSGAVTTDEVNCLVFSFINFDGAAKLTPENPAQVMPLLKESYAGACSVLTFFNQITAAATPTVNYLSEVASEGGSVWTIAVEDADPTNAQLSPTVSTSYQVVNRYGGITTAPAATAAFIRHESVTWQQLSNIAATTIGPLDVLDTAFTEIAFQSTQNIWGTMTGVNIAVGAVDNTGRWVGATHTIPSTDFSNKIIHLEFQISSNVVSRFGPEGIILYLEDSFGEWAAFQLSQRQGLLQSLTYTAHLDTNSAPYDGSGIIDFTDIVRIAHMYHKRTTATNAVIMRIQNLLLFNTVNLVDGCAADPISPSKVVNAFTGHSPYLSASLQGAAQGLPRAGFTLGNGSRKSYTDLTASSTEFPLRANASLGRRLWKVGDNCPAADITIDASAGDIVNFTSCVLATDVPQNLTIDPGSSTDAVYDFSGASIVRWDITNNVAGIDFNNATIQECNLFFNGGGLDSCNIVECGAVNCNSTDAIVNNSFTSPGAGHAIRITATGSFDLIGNTFTGYGADNTTSAAVYNNSGGLVTLTLGAGDPIPTVRNSAGSSTVINAAPVNISATVLADSRVELFNVTTATQIDNVFETTTSYSYTVTSEATAGDTIRLRVTKKGYLSTEAVGTFTATGLSFIISQTLDSVYAAYGIDGDTVTKFDPDYINTQVDLNIASNFAGAEFYAWYSANLATEEGIENFFGGVTAIDEGNIRINDSIVDIKFDNTTSTNVFQNDNIRIFRADADYPVQNPTSGGGGIDLVWRNQVFTVAIGGSALTPTESAWLSDINNRTARVDGLVEDVSGDRFTAKALETAGGGGLTLADIADAVWDEPIAGHLTAGSTGAALDGASAPSASTVASAVRTELTTELARIDVATSTRLATSGYTAPPSVVDIRSEMDSNSTKLDVAVGSRASQSSVDGLNDISAAEVNTQVDLALSDYDAPTKAELDALETTLLTAIGSGGVTPAEVYDYFAFGTRPDIFKADLTGVLTEIATRASSTELTAQTSTLLTAIGSGGVTPSQIYDYFTDLTRADAFKADLTQVLTDIATRSSSAELTAQTSTLLTAIGSGGVTPAEVYDYFVELNRADAFKADVSDLATTVQLDAAEAEIIDTINNLDVGDVFRNEQVNGIVVPSENINAEVIQNQTLTGIVQE